MSDKNRKSIQDANTNELDFLRRPVTIPACVQEKAEDAFRTIKAQPRQTAAGDAGAAESTSPEHRKSPRRIALATLLAAAVLGTGVFAATRIYDWSRGIENGMQLTDKEKKIAEEAGLADNPGRSITAGRSSGSESSESAVPAIQILTETDSQESTSEKAALSGAVKENSADSTQMSAGSTESELQPDASGSVKSSSDGEDVTSVTVNGVTVSAAQTLVDPYRAVITLKIHGLKLPEHPDPNVGEFWCYIDGVDANWSGSFYDGLIAGPDGMALHDDGTPIDWDEKSGEPFPFRYADENGDLEYDISFENDGEPGALNGKKITVGIKNLIIGTEQSRLTDSDSAQTESVTEADRSAGTSSETEASGSSSDPVTVEGTWELHWILRGTDSMQTFKPNQEAGNSGAVVTKVELSPISMKLTMNYAFQPTTETGVDEDGNPVSVDSYVQPPSPVGLKMADGTFRLGILDTSMEGFGEDPSDNIYTMQFRIETVVDPNQVEAILFPAEGYYTKIKQLEDSGSADSFDLNSFRDDDFYEVSLK